MAWFLANEQFPNARRISCTHFPKYFLSHKGRRIWTPKAKYRKRGSGGANYEFSKVFEKFVGRMFNISPREGERYFLRILLLNKTGATSSAHIRTHEGVQYSTFREACCAMGLLSDDAEWIRCIYDSFSSNLILLQKSLV